MSGLRRWRDAGRLPILLLAVAVAIAWIGLARLGTAFVRLELDWEYVAEQSRRGAPWAYRLAGIWGGMAGSLLLFSAIVATAMLVAAKRASLPARWAAAGTGVALLAVSVTMASPFRRLPVPSVQGFGLNPILEHPMMAIHPPLLYAGLATAAAASASAAWRPPDERWCRARPWLLWCVGLLTVSMTLGAAWSYMEQGWGGYWAWDPVENSSLIVWLAALVALHAVPITASPALTSAAIAAPWTLGLFGAALVRSGRTPSVHGFAEQLGIGRALLVIALVTTAAIVADVRAAGGRRLLARPEAPERGRRDVAAALFTAAAAVVIAGTAYPAGRDLVTGTMAAVRGEFFARLVGPLAAVAVPFLLVQLFRSRRWSLIAHCGMLVLLAGVAVSTFDRADSVAIAAGATQPAAGVDVVNRGLDVVAGTRIGTDEVVATLEVDGRTMEPRLVVYRDRAGRLSEVAVRSGWWTDTHAVLDGADDDGSVRVTIQRRRGMWLVWLGAAVVAAGAIGSDLARHRRPGGGLSARATKTRSRRSGRQTIRPTRAGQPRRSSPSARRRRLPARRSPTVAPELVAPSPAL